MRGDDVRMTYVWLDIVLFPNCLNCCKLPAVKSFYVYAAAADDLFIIALDSVRVSTGVIS